MNTTALSGIAYLPPYGGAWHNCTRNIETIFNKSFSVKLVDNSTPITPGFGDYAKGNSSLNRIYDIGFVVSLKVMDLNHTELKDPKDQLLNVIYYCNTSEYSVTQCDSQFIGLPFQNQTGLQWCLSIKNPYNNSQKANVSFDSDETSTNTNIINISANGVAHNLNNKHLLLVLLILFQMLWEYL
ncbi:17429_t:CDS:2 [Cetraspora pellucida]|uniref:17429_t:CDS:1 n=1 Tax=Cetraspora pellucida TaxID=1433469 RepID=A0A9N9J0J2_9GLOM|nr:17429_t:CDS:2 [Cetraspora pellucida]